MCFELSHNQFGKWLSNWKASSLTSYKILRLVFQTFVYDRFTVSGGAFHMDDVVSKEECTPVVMIIPGLTSDSASPVS